ncbi:MAG TPA: 50S ribosomal protein L25/general stress protein Ctc [Usitatibacter sp.]|jgi:large subunit ribosomal protein L25|nr:50S ribosomal protein L25/general stress protein Ctc [Usitatibacter sp.]
MKIAIKAEPRSVQGTGASRRLRRESKVPGVVYGAGKDATPIQLDHKELWFKLKTEAFHASILELEIGNDKSQVLLRDYQMHPFRPLILHADFQRVAADRKIHMSVPLHFINELTSPGVKVAGGLVEHVLKELEISCLPKDLPEYIEVDLGNLQAGHSLHLSAVKLPPGVEPIVPKGEDPTIATIVIPKVMTAEEEAAEAAATAIVSAADVPTTAQKTKEEEAAEAASAAKAGGGKEAVKPAAGKEEKKDKEKK